MAFKAGAVLTEFKAGMKNFKAGVKTAKRELDTFGTKAKATGLKMKSVGKNLTTHFTLPLAIATGAIVKFGADFENAMTQSTAIMQNMTGELKKEMSDLARSMALESSQSAKELAESYYFLASAGMDAEESMAALPKVATFATAGQFEMKTATDLLTDAQSALGLRVDDTAESMENMARISDVLVRGATLANASVEQFATSLTNRAASALRNANKRIEEGVAVLAVFADQGLKGRRAGMELSRMLRYMEQAARDNKEEMKAWNVSVYDGEGNLRNFADIVEDMENALGGLSDAEKSAALDQMGFTAETQALIKMLIGASEQIREYEKELNNAGGTTDEVAKEQMTSMTEQLKLLKDALIETALQLYDFARPTIQHLVIPIVKNLLKFLRLLGGGFNKLPTWIKVGIGGIVAFVGALGPMLWVGGQVLTMLGSIGPAIAKVTTFLAGGHGLTWAAKSAAVAMNLLKISFTPFLVGGAVIAGVIALWQQFKKVEKASKNIKGELIEIHNLERAQQKLKDIRDSMEFIEQRAKKSGMGAGGALLERGQNAQYEELKRKEQEVLRMIEDLEKEKQEARDETTEAQGENAEDEKENTEKSEEEKTEITEEELAERQRLREEFEEEWEEKLFRATHNRIDILRYEKHKALEQAEEMGADKEDISSYYENEITKIRREERKAREEEIQKEVQAEKEAQEEKLKARQSLEEQYADKYREITSTRIEQLEYEREQVLEQAERIGASKENIYKYYEEMITQTKQQETDNRVQITLEGQEKEIGIIEETYNTLNSELEVAANKNKVFGDSFDYNEKRLGIYQNAINKLLENGVSPFNHAVVELYGSFNTLKEEVTENNKEMTTTESILVSMKKKLENIKDMANLFGDEVDFASESQRTLKTTIEELIRGGLEPESNIISELMGKYLTLKDISSNTYEAIKTKAVDATEAVKQLNRTMSDTFTHGGIFGLEEMAARQNEWFRAGFSAEEMSVSSPTRYNNQNVSQQNTNYVNVYNEIKDKETAKETVDDLISTLEDKKLGDVI